MSSECCEVCTAHGIGPRELATTTVQQHNNYSYTYCIFELYDEYIIATS